jgi:hypothetical protein
LKLNLLKSDYKHLLIAPVNMFTRFKQMIEREAALAKGDFSAYGRAQDRLKSAIAAALAAQARK